VRASPGEASPSRWAQIADVIEGKLTAGAMPGDGGRRLCGDPRGGWISQIDIEEVKSLLAGCYAKMDRKPLRDDE